MTAGERDALFAHIGLATSDVLALLDLATGTDVTELDVRVNGARIRLRRPPLVIASGTADESSGVADVAEESGAVIPLAIASPLVGIFRADVKPGDAVQTGQSIGKIEVLGMPTSVDAPQSGTVDEMLVRDGSPVEYGQPLLILRRAVHAS